MTPVEISSALYRRRTDGDLTERHFRAIVSRLRHDRTHRELVDVTPLVLEKAEELIGRARVRTLDATHLVSAMVFQDVSRLRIPILSADKRQSDVAKELAFEVIRVG